jgi:hypothetical protein
VLVNLRSSSWMEGLVLMFLYLIIAVSFWYYPVSRISAKVPRNTDDRYREVTQLHCLVVRRISHCISVSLKFQGGMR